MPVYFSRSLSSAFLNSGLWAVPLLSWDILLSSCFSPLSSCSLFDVLHLFYTFSRWHITAVLNVTPWSLNGFPLESQTPQSFEMSVTTKDSHGADSQWSSKTNVASEHHSHRVAWSTQGHMANSHRGKSSISSPLPSPVLGQGMLCSKKAWLDVVKRRLWCL